MSLFLQAFLVALAVTIAFIDAHTTQTHIFRPIFIGPLVGAIMGDFNTGLQVGVTVELMFLAVIFVGTAVPPNPTISTAIATAVAILGGGGTDLAVATALPVSFIGQIAETVQNSVINVWFMHRAEHAIERAGYEQYRLYNGDECPSLWSTNLSCCIFWCRFCSRYH